MAFNKQIVADNLCAERARRHMSREQLSKVSGIPATTIGNYEQGVTTPNLENAWKLADVFGMSIDYLFGRVEKVDVSA